MVYKSEESECFGGQSSQSRLEGLRENLRDRASSVKHQVQEGAHRAKDWFSDSMDEYPLLMGGACVLLGLAAGLAIPTSKPERQVLSRTKRTIMTQAQDVGSRLIEKGEQVAGQAVEAIRGVTRRHEGGVD